MPKEVPITYWLRTYNGPPGSATINDEWEKLDATVNIRRGLPDPTVSSDGAEKAPAIRGSEGAKGGP